jgi:hypothetical protein
LFFIKGAGIVAKTSSNPQRDSGWLLVERCRGCDSLIALPLTRSGATSARRPFICKCEKAAEGYLFLLEKDAEYDVDSSFGM